MLDHPTAVALREWVVVFLKEVVLVALVGFAEGYLVGWLQRWATTRDHSLKPSLMTIVVALTFTTLGAVKQRYLQRDGVRDPRKNSPPFVTLTLRCLQLVR